MPTPPSMMPSDPVPFTKAGIWRGALKAQPLAIGVLAYGVAFGLIADQGGLSLLQALLMSGIVYSGSAQLAAISVLAAGPQPIASVGWALVATILVINARYMLFSASLRPWLGQVSAGKAYSTLFVLGDGNWMLSMRAYEDGERDAGFILGSGAAMFVPWLLGTWIGYAASNFAVDPKRLGIDFMMVAFAAAMMTGMARARTDLAIIGVAGVVAVAVALAGFPSWSPVLAGLAGGMIAWMRHAGPETEA